MMTTIDEKTAATLKEIKQSFRLLMNGVTAQSMREKGVNYHLNWGANLLHLKEMAQEYEASKPLAMALWKENIRECKILATMLMPKEAMDIELAMLWVEQTPTQEVAEVATQYLYQYLPFAAEMALKMIASTEDMQQLVGFTILSRLFANGTMIDERDINEFMDQAISVLGEEGKNEVRHRALNAVQHFADMDEQCYMIAKGALKSVKMEEWL